MQVLFKFRCQNCGSDFYRDVFAEIATDDEKMEEFEDIACAAQTVCATHECSKSERGVGLLIGATVVKEKN